MLEKILQEIEQLEKISFSSYTEPLIELKHVKEIINKHIQENDRWITVEDEMPEERDSIFAEWKGTNKWNAAMFEKISDDVNVTVEYEDGTRKTITGHTVDGEWQFPNRLIKQKSNCMASASGTIQKGM